MSLESIARVQSRIASIQGRALPSATASPPTKVNSNDFAALLSQFEGQAGTSPSGMPDVSALPTSFPIENFFSGPVVGAGAAASISGSDKTQRFVDLALAQNGDNYVMGHEVNLSDIDPATFDCSELVEWAAGNVGVKVPDGSWLQYLDLKQRNALMPVEEALNTRGALLFSFSSEPQPGGGRPSAAHVAISLGDGRTIEARGKDYGVGIFEAGDRFEYAGMIPDLA